MSKRQNTAHKLHSKLSRLTFRTTGQTSGHRTKYSYDNLGQVTSGKRKWQDGSFVAGQQYEYTFDEIGNRIQTKVGGDVNGANLRSASYTPNLLNQHDQRAVPGAVDILGLGVPSTEVRVDNIIASRKGESFHHPLTVDNSSNPQYKTVSVVSGTESSSGNIFVPKTPEQYDDPATPTVNEGYDEDGNQLRDGRWNYTWDAENRLVKIESLATAPAGSRRRLEFAYDFMGRRIWKKLTNLETSAVTEERFLYDGWNLVAVLSPSSATILKSFVWGTDLSGSFQGAGGVGGLLKVNHLMAPVSSAFVAYDGNGNVAGLIDASNGSIAAQYEYGPFGEVLRSTGPVAKVNPFRFSTKYQDDETDLLYYGYRYYDASTGRWLSRDPIDEFGGVALYGMVQNDTINHYDRFGLLGPLAGFAVDCIKEVAGSLAGEWLKNQGDREAACGLVFDEVRSRSVHIGCGGELVIASSPFLNNERSKSWGGRIASCLWGRIKSRGIGKILKDLPEGVERELLEEAIGGAIENLEAATTIADAKHQIRATCGEGGINVAVFTQVTLSLGEKTFDLRTEEKKLGSCRSLDASSIYDLGCRCCANSRFHPDHRKEP